MCIYTAKNKNYIKKNSSRGVRDTTECAKIRRFRRRGYRKNLQRFRHVMLHTGR